MFVAASCGNTEKAEADQDAAEAEQTIYSSDVIEQARMDARNAAKDFLGCELPDTMSIQQALLEAKAKQSKYSGKGNKAATAAFDSTFVSTLATVRPELARQLIPADSNAK